MFYDLCEMHDLFYLFKNRFTWYLILSAVLSNMRNMTLCIKWRLILSQCIIPLMQKTITARQNLEELFEHLNQITFEECSFYGIYF